MSSPDRPHSRIAAALAFREGARSGHEYHGIRRQVDTYVATSGRFFEEAFADIKDKPRSNTRRLQFSDPTGRSIVIERRYMPDLQDVFFEVTDVCAVDPELLPEEIKKRKFSFSYEVNRDNQVVQYYNFPQRRVHIDYQEAYLKVITEALADGAPEGSIVTVSPNIKFVSDGTQWVRDTAAVG
jgi:hypothetical protein